MNESKTVISDEYTNKRPAERRIRRPYLPERPSPARDIFKDLNKDVFSETQCEQRPQKREKTRSKLQERELEWWVGQITEVEQDSFTCKLEDLKGRKNIVEFDKEVLDPNDIDFLRIGSLLTYSVFYMDKHDGRTIGSKVTLSAPRKWSKEYEERSEELLKELPEDFFDY